MKATSLVYTNKGSAYIAVLLQGKINDEVIVLEKHSLREISRTSVPTLKWPDDISMTISPILISDDDSKLIVVSKGAKNLEINIYDLNSSEELFNRKLGVYGHHISRSIDNKFIIFESQSSKKRLFTVIDIKSLKTSALVNLGQSPITTHVFNNSLFVSTQRSPKRNKYYSLSKIDFKNNKKTKYKTHSLTPFVFVHDAHQNQLYVAGKNTKKKKDLFVMTFDKDLSFEVKNFAKKVKPIKSKINKNNTKLMIIGENKLATVDIKKNMLQSYIRIPFDPLNGFMNTKGTIAYVQEDKGSQVGNFDLVSGKLIEQSNAGRFFNQVIVNTRRFVISGLTQYFFMRQNSQKNIMLDNLEKNLFVINATTNDLSIFDAQSLKKQLAIGTGFKTYFMSQGPNKKSPFLIVGKNRISLFDSQLNNEVLKLPEATMKGLDNDKDLLFYTLGNTLHVYDMLNRKEVSQLNMFNPLAVYVY
ncbi:MAG: hypothetical protein L3J52_02890 [Proteobacteria bacterium]|nr:hypothetical protein [Pseudomonadota bacterium]